MTDREFLKKKEQTSKIDFRKIGFILWNMKYILIVSIMVCLTVAYFYVRYTVPVYKKNITIVLNNQQTQYADNYQLISNTLGVKSEKRNDNQVFIVKSARLMSRVVKQGNFNVRYFDTGGFVDIERYKDSPVKFSFEPVDNHKRADINMRISLSGEKGIFIDSLLINDEVISLPVKKINLEQPVNTPLGTICLTSQGNTDLSKVTGQMRIMRLGVEDAARGLSSALEITSSAQQQDVLMISLKGRHPGRVEDILNILISEYNILTKENDSQSILSTITFLDERIRGLEEELKKVEGSLAEYLTANELLDVNSKSQIVINSNEGYKERLNELVLQLSLLENIKGFFRNDSYELIPVNIGITDGILNSSISQYNQHVIERNKLLAVSSENNPRVQALNELLVTLKENIRQSITNLETGYNLQLKSISKQQHLNQRELVSIPSKQLALTRMARLQQVKEPLYILLQQKREEALLMLSSLSNQAYVVDNASGSDLPIFPQSKEIYMLALFIGVLIPVGIVLILNVLREKIIFEKDIVDRTDIPLLGIVPSVSKSKNSPMRAHMINKTGCDPLTESFRMLRSKLENLEITKKKQGGLILQISSSGRWEGKSFISVNMSLSLAYLGKKVLLIGGDLHEAAFSKFLEINDDKMGLSAYLKGDIADIHQTIILDKDVQNLDIIPAGPIPVDSSELLSRPLLQKALDTLRDEYDYIIIDSAPFLTVSDGFIISKCVDCTLYIVRSGHTKLSIIDTLNNVMREGSLNSVMLMLNAVDFNKKSIYGVGESYSYGYSYGYVDYCKKKKND